MSLERAHLVPSRPGLRVLDPDHGDLPLPPEGREVGLSSYWIRRLQDGDVKAEHPRLAETSRPSKERDKSH